MPARTALVADKLTGCSGVINLCRIYYRVALMQAHPRTLLHDHSPDQNRIDVNIYSIIKAPSLVTEHALCRAGLHVDAAEVTTGRTTCSMTTVPTLAYTHAHPL